MTLQEFLEDADYETRPYSGRGMYGKKCLAVTADDPVSAALKNYFTSDTIMNYNMSSSGRQPNAMRYTPENIFSLATNEVFVFGSNLKGRHGAGAAKLALLKFGAIYGVGEGITGRCYAFPTLTGSLGHRTQAELEASRDLLFETARAKPDNIFLLTKVGCGLAGYAEATMRELFLNAPANVIKPEGW